MMIYNRYLRGLYIRAVLLNIFVINMAVANVSQTDRHTSVHKPPCKIVTSFSILHDLVFNIVGHRCAVESIVGANEDAHVFEPKPSTNILIQSADVIVINGLGFETWMQRLLTATHYQGPVIIAASNIKPIYVHTPQNAEPVPDPHAWHTIANATTYVDEITQRLCKIYPDYCHEFHHNAHLYKIKLYHLEQQIRHQLTKLPTLKKRVITAHDAFNYLSAEYDIEFLSPQGISTDTDPSAKHIATLIDQIKEHRIKAIFVENIASDKLIKQLIDETGIVISGKLYSDALSSELEPASTYLTLMHHNMTALITAMVHNDPTESDTAGEH